MEKTANPVQQLLILTLLKKKAEFKEARAVLENLLYLAYIAEVTQVEKSEEPLKYTDPDGKSIKSFLKKYFSTDNSIKKYRGIDLTYMEKNFASDKFPLQTDVYLNIIAQFLTKKGLRNPKRWACYFMSCVYSSYKKMNTTPSRTDIIAIANKAYGVPDTSFKNINRDTLGNNYYVGDAYNLMNITVEYEGGNYICLSANKKNADFTIIVFDIVIKNGKKGQHYAVGDKNGNLVFDPDPTLKSKVKSMTRRKEPIYFKWRKNNDK